MGRAEIRVLVTDHSPFFGAQVVRELHQLGFSVIGMACEGKMALDMILRYRPGLVIVDLNLPGLDVRALAKEMAELPELPVTLTTSAVLSDFVMGLSNRLRARYLVPKPCDPETLAQRVEDVICWREKGAFPEPEELIYRWLLEQGISAHMDGFRYLQAAVLLGLRDPELSEAVTKLLYPRVALQCASTPIRVERSIRHALERAWELGLLQKRFPRPHRPTNSEFIAQTIHSLRLCLGQLTAQNR